MTNMTNEEYVSAHGLKCPYCRGTDLNSKLHKAYFELGDVCVPAECENCGETFIERYVIAEWEE